MVGGDTYLSAKADNFRIRALLPSTACLGVLCGWRPTKIVFVDAKTPAYKNIVHYTWYKLFMR